MLSSLATLICMGESVSAAMPDPDQSFRAHIGAADSAHPLRSGSGAVLATWPNAHDLFHLGPEWQVTDDVVLIPSGTGASHLYGAMHGEHRFEGEVFVAADGFAGAVDRLVEVATNTMMMVPPYDPAPEPLRFGELAVRSTDVMHQTLMWTFRNLCLRVTTSHGGDVTAALAAQLRDFVQLHVVDPEVVQRAQPQLALPAKPVTLHLGQVLRIDPHPAGAPGAASLMLRARPDNLAVTARAQQPDLLELYAREAGHTRFAVVLADTRTLLCSAGRIEVISG